MIKDLSGIEKATLLLSILGPQKAARILRHLPDDMANLLSAKVATLPPPDSDTIKAIYSEISNKAISAAPTDKPMEIVEDTQENKDIVAENEDALSNESTEEEILEDLAEDILGDDNEVDINENTEKNEASPIMYIPTKNIVSVLKNEKNKIQNIFLLSIDKKKSDDIKTVLEIETNTDIILSPVVETPVFQKVKDLIVNEVIKKAEDL